MEPIPDDVRRFLSANIESVEQLEIIRILFDRRDEGCVASALASQVQAPLSRVVSHLLSLAAKGLCAVDDHSGEPVGRFAPRTPPLEAELERMLKLYRTRPVTMIKLVYEQADQRLRAFSDAFKFRKDD